MSLGAITQIQAKYIQFDERVENIDQQIYDLSLSNTQYTHKENKMNELGSK